MCLLAEGLVNDEVRDAFLRLQDAMNRMHIRVAALEAATVLLLRTNAGNANVADEFERSIRHYLQGMDQHRDHVFAFEEIVEPWLGILREPLAGIPPSPSR